MKTPEQLTHVLLFTDGASVNEFGGWAFLLVDPEEETAIERSGACFFKTNENRMEFLAVVCGLERIKRWSKQKARVVLFSSLGEELAARLPKWKKHRYQIENGDLWKRLDELCKMHAVTVGKHNGATPYSERVSQLAKTPLATLLKQ
jgi:ribonuclease HI